MTSAKLNGQHTAVHYVKAKTVCHEFPKRASLQIAMTNCVYCGMNVMLFSITCLLLGFYIYVVLTDSVCYLLTIPPGEQSIPSYYTDTSIRLHFGRLGTQPMSLLAWIIALHHGPN